MMAGRKKAGENTVLSSMTGFARGNGHDERFNWTWELKSVNSKGLDIRCRTPSGFDALEGPARAAAATRFTRGNLTMTLQLKPVAGSASVTVNRELLEHLLEVVRNYQDAPGVLPPRLDGLLGIRGIIEPMEPEESENEVAARADAVLQSLEIVLDDLYAARGEEGERLGSILRNHVEEIENLVGSAMDSAAAQPEVLAARLSEQLSQILQISPPLPEERLAQELATLLVKADVREELDRLIAHVASAKDLLDAGGAIGRRLDFLAQELNREANTLCSKAADVALTQVGLDLKATIDRFREQVQNLE